MPAWNQHDERICPDNRRIGLQVIPTLSDLEIVRIDDHDEQCPRFSGMPLPTRVELLRKFAQHPPDVATVYLAARDEGLEAWLVRVELR